MRARVSRHGISLGVNDGLCTEAAAKPAGVAVLQGKSRLHPEAHTQLTAELVIRDHNAALDGDLAHGRIELAYEFADFFEARRSV